MTKLRKSRWLRITLIGVSICIVSAGIFALVDFRPENRTRLMWGWHTVAVVQQADQVTLYHIQGEGEWQKHIIGKPVTASPDLARRLKAVVANPKSYIWPDPYMCLPSPNLLVQFHRGTETVNAYFCFDCHEAAIGDDGEFTAFDPMWNQMVSFVKEAFPNDAVLQSLKLRQYRSHKGISPKG